MRSDGVRSAAWCCLLVAVTSVAGGSVEVLTPNVVTDRSKVLDSVKAKWTQTLSVGGAKAKLVTIVQPSAKKDFLKELSLSGSVNDIAYTLKQKIGGGAVR